MGARSATSSWARVSRALVSLLVCLLISAAASAQDASEGKARDALLEWDLDVGALYLTLSFRDVIDAKIQDKLSRGLPTTIVFTAAIYRASSPEPVSTTVQTCKVTWHVWEEAYRVEVMRPGNSQIRWTTTLEGVMRRCAEVRRLIAADRSQISELSALRVTGKIQVNPVSPEVLQKIQRWVMRPASTGTAAPGDALFSTFTGLFLQRIGEAEREVKFVSRARTPSTFHSRDEQQAP